MNKHKNNAGFTIVELLIVIVVIAILAAITVVAYNGITQRSKDSERYSEMASIQKALELYHADFSAYPTCSGTGPNTLNALSSGSAYACLFDDLVPKYMASIPSDPTNTGSYIYRYASGYRKTGAVSFNSSQTDNYILGVKQEASSGPYYSGWGMSDLSLLLGSGN